MYEPIPLNSINPFIIDKEVQKSKKIKQNALKEVFNYCFILYLYKNFTYQF